jgi:hypothetical protein
MGTMIEVKLLHCIFLSLSAYPTQKAMPPFSRQDCHIIRDYLPRLFLSLSLSYQTRIDNCTMYYCTS